MRALAMTAAASAMILVAGCGKKDEAATTNVATGTDTTTAMTANADAPKPGLWEVATKVAGKDMPAAKVCFGETTVGSNPFNGSNSGDCTGSAPTKTATGYEFTSECTSNGSKATTKGSVSGDMSSKFTVNIMTNVNGKDMGMETTYTRTGDCAAGQAPGPVAG